MNLCEFITETLTQISDGVKDAQGKLSAHGARVNPNLTTSADLAIKHGLIFASGSAAQLVQFDVAVSVAKEKGTKGGIGLIVGPVTLGSTGQSKSEDSSISRVRFVVPLVLPESNR